MWSFLVLQKGYIRQWWMPQSHFLLYTPGFKGAALRLYDWLASKDQKMGKAKPWNYNNNFKFAVGDTVSINRSKRIGMVMYKFRSKHGVKLYQVQVHKHTAIFYECELTPTKYRVYGDVDIKEIEFKCLTDGTYYRRTIPTFFEPFPTQSPKPPPITSSRHYAVG